MSHPSAKPLVDRPALDRARRRISGTEPLFAHRLAQSSIEERLSVVNRTFSDVAVVTGHAEVWANIIPNATVVPDEDTLALLPGTLDLVVHAMCLHWANDPVGQVIQCARALRPDGLFIAICPGGQTLSELRTALAEAEAQVTGGLSPRVLPMGDVRDLGAVLQRAGLALPVADVERHDVSYRSVINLMHDLRAMGETNALTARPKRFTRREVMLRAAAAYPDQTEDGGIKATLDLVTLTAWAPAPSQPKPLRPGSAKERLADVLNTIETATPDRDT